MKISHLIFGLLSLVLLLCIGYAISVLPYKVTFVLAIGIMFSLLIIINLETGLFIFIFVIPFTQQLNIAKVGVMPIDIGTDDIFIIFMMLSWLAGLARRKEPIIRKTSLNWPIVAFFTVGVISFIGADMRFGQGAILLSSLHLFKFFEYVAIYFIVVSIVDDFDQIKRLLWMFFIVAGFIAMVQFIAMLRLGYFNVKIPLAGGEVSLLMQTMHAFISNAILGAYYAFFISILSAIILYMPRSKNKTLLILFVFILSYALFSTYSRSAYLGLFVSFLVLALLKERRLLAIVLMLIAFTPTYMQPGILKRITFTVQSLSPVLLDPSATIRLVLWKRGLLAFLNNPIFGTGYWTTRHVIKAEAHSQYVALLIEMGIIGFFVFLWLIVRMYKNSINLMEKGDTYFLKALGLGYIAGLSALLITCFFSETLEAFRMTGPLWFITGLIASANRLLSEEKAMEGA